MNNTSRWQHLAKREQAALSDFVNQLQRQFNHGTIQSVWLFGSKIRGTDDAESDIDLLIVVRHYTWKLEKAITELAVEIDLAHDIVLSDHIVDKKHYDRMVAQGILLYRNVKEEGIDLWQMEPQPIT